MSEPMNGQQDRSIQSLGQSIRLGFRRCPDHFTPDKDCSYCLTLSAASASLALLLLRCATAEQDWAVQQIPDKLREHQSVGLFADAADLIEHQAAIIAQAVVAETTAS